VAEKNGRHQQQDIGNIRVASNTSCINIFSFKNKEANPFFIQGGNVLDFEVFNNASSAAP
jgi:hypothetical protein